MRQWNVENLTVSLGRTGATHALPIANSDPEMKLIAVMRNKSMVNAEILTTPLRITPWGVKAIAKTWHLLAH